LQSTCATSGKFATFGQSVDRKLDQLKKILPADLIIAHTSDQPLQVKENIHLFLRALYEAILLVVVVSLIGFWEWRLALIMALAIPITLGMTFGVSYMLGIDLQQVSVADADHRAGPAGRRTGSSGDGIKRGLADGLPRAIAAWLVLPAGDRNLFRNANEYHRLSAFPHAHRKHRGIFLGVFHRDDSSAAMRSGRCDDICAAAGLLHQRPPKKKELTVEEKRQRGFYGFYNRLVGRAIQHRWLVLAGSFLFLLIGGLVASHLKQQFFPEDVQYWVLPRHLVAERRAFDRNKRRCAQGGAGCPPGCRSFGENRLRGRTGQASPHLHDKFHRRWRTAFLVFDLSRSSQTNYAQVIVQVTDKEATPKLIGPLQSALNKQVPGAWITVRQLQTNPVETPVEILISGQADTDPRAEIQTYKLFGPWLHRQWPLSDSPTELRC